MRCEKCGQANPATNFFCGNCGSPLFQRSAATHAAQPPSSTPRPNPRTAPASSQPNDVAERHPLTPSARQDEGDPISGPSFLGLAGTNTENTITPLDYLYEDAPSRSYGRWIAVVVILAAFAAFLAYQRKKLPDWYSAIVRPVNIALRQTATQTQDTAQPPNTGNGDIQPNTPSPPNTATAPNRGGQAGENAAQNSTAPASGVGPPGLSAPAAVNKLPSANSAGMPAPTAEGSSLPEVAAREEAIPPSVADSGGPDASSPNSPRPLSSLQKKTSALPRDASPDQPPVQDQADRLFTRGVAYLNGRGVPRSCSQALVYLNKAADMGSAKAAGQLGGLYATGHCVPLDRARAYAYFTRARNEAPGRNVYLEHNRSMLWSQMNPAERAQVQPNPE